MPGEPNLNPRIPRAYRIVLLGRLDPSWSDWMNGIRVDAARQSDGTTVTVLNGLLSDQAALRGLLNRIWDLNLELISVEQVRGAEKQE